MYLRSNINAHFGKQAGPVWEGFEKLGKVLGMFWESCLFTVNVRIWVNDY